MNPHGSSHTGRRPPKSPPPPKSRALTPEQAGMSGTVMRAELVSPRTTTAVGCTVVWLAVRNLRPGQEDDAWGGQTHV